MYTAKHNVRLLGAVTNEELEWADACFKPVNQIIILPESRMVNDKKVRLCEL